MEETATWQYEREMMSALREEKGETIESVISCQVQRLCRVEKVRTIEG
jgi:hypothetical protein